MSTLPLLFSERHRRNSISQRPHKVGGAFSLNLGQLHGPFLDKDYHLENKKSIGMLTTRSFHSRRYSSDSHRVISATYTTFSKHLAFIPEESFQVEDAQSFRADSKAVEGQIDICWNKLSEAGQEEANIREQMKAFRKQMQQQLEQIEGGMLRSFKELRSKLFDFSRCDNNTHLALVKRQTATFQDTLNTLKAHYEFAEKKLGKLQLQFKGKEEAKLK